MKIEIIDDDNLIIYYSLVLDDILQYSVDNLKTFIQMLIVRLRKKYHLDLKGYYHLDVYIKKIVILEFHRVDDYDDEIDLNIMIHTNAPILIEFDDYFLITEKKSKKYYYQEKYYISIDQIDYEKYVEFIRIIYNEEAKKIIRNALLLGSYVNRLDIGSRGI